MPTRNLVFNKSSTLENPNKIVDTVKHGELPAAFDGKLISLTPVSTGTITQKRKGEGNKSQNAIRVGRSRKL